MTEIARKAALQDQPDTLALIDAAFGPGTRDILCNGEHVKGEPRYLSDLIEELAASRVAQARKQALEESAAEAESWKGQKLRLMAGEMSGPELRAARTVTTTIARVLRNRAEVTGETS
jgi:hypothetical protein